MKRRKHLLQRAAVSGLVLCLLFSACGKRGGETERTAPVPDNTSSLPLPEVSGVTIPELEPGKNTLTVTVTEGTADCWRLENGTLTFSGLAADTLAAVTGEFDGAIVIDPGDDFAFELELRGLTLYSSAACPVTVLSGDGVTLTAKKDTENFIYDTREALPEDTEEYRAAVWADVDLSLQGKGALTVVSAHNNGVHTKDDLKVKNLTLSVTCADNALKGNDSVTVTGGILDLVALSGDGIKTSSTGLSKKGKQQGNVTLSGCALNVRAAADAVDAAWDLLAEADTVITAVTGTGEQPEGGNAPAAPETPGAPTVPVSFTSDLFGGGGFGGGGFGGGGFGGGGRGERPGNVPGGQSGGQPGGRQPGGMTPPGGFGGGGFGEGNREKSAVSAKGLKAGNSLVIDVGGGSVTVSAADDALHSGTDAAAESGLTPAGSAEIRSGALTLYSADDAVHADGVLTVSGGEVRITGCYEGLEGSRVVIEGGQISVTSRDDGVNSTAVEGDGITLNGGRLAVFAGGDGLDANTRTSGAGIVFNAGTAVVLSSSGGNSALDTERGYTYRGGRVLALCPTGSMTNEVTNCTNFSSVGVKASLSLKAGDTVSTVSASGEAGPELVMPQALNAFAVYLCGSAGKVSTAARTAADPDADGVVWNDN